MRSIGIIGLGLIGGSLALALRRAHAEMRILGVDSDPATREAALRAQAVHEAADLDAAELSLCDLVVLAVPAPALLDLILPVAARMHPGAVLTDVCGSKEAVCARGAAQERVAFVGAHPMAGTEFRGFASADARLFEGATVAICPARGRASDGAAETLVRELWTAAGATRLLGVEAEAHDRAVTWASHLPYLAAAAVVDSLRSSAGGAEELARALAAGGFRDTTRLAGDGTVGGAASLNRHVPGAARALAESLRALAAQLEADPESARARLTALAEERRTMKLPPRRPQ